MRNGVDTGAVPGRYLGRWKSDRHRTNATVQGIELPDEWYECWVEHPARAKQEAL